MDKKLKTPPFLRLSDKLAFTIGVATIMFTQYLLLLYPQMMYLWYSLLFIPVSFIPIPLFFNMVEIVVDFVALLLLFSNEIPILYAGFLLLCSGSSLCLVVHIPQHLIVQNCVRHVVCWIGCFFSHSFLFFLLSNGPLAIGIVMWRNSLVFHDLDKVTSVFIHIFPPLGTQGFSLILSKLILSN